MSRKMRSVGLTLALLSSFSAPGHSAPSSRVDDRGIREIVDTCLVAFEQHYVYPGVVSDIELYVRAKLDGGKYDEITDLLELTKRLRGDFRHVAEDRHIWIDILENIPVKNSDLSLAEIAEIKRKRNFGFARYELMPGNVGYLEIENFNDLAYGRETAAHAMGLLASSDAVILDLRNNHGGNGNMVHFIASYLFAERTQLNSLYFREADSLATAWTDPDLPGQKLFEQELYLLTSGNTASAAESFAYTLKHYGRATIVGEVTRGAAHWNETFRFPELDIFLEIPVARPINPVTGKGWQGKGVIPQVKTLSGDALDQAHLLALESLGLE